MDNLTELENKIRCEYEKILLDRQEYLRMMKDVEDNLNKYKSENTFLKIVLIIIIYMYLYGYISFNVRDKIETLLA